MLAYVLACTAMGLGIGFDVMLATFSRLKYLAAGSSRTWVQRITVTHVFFPMLGYYFFIGLFRAYPILGVALGLVAFGLVAWFLSKAVIGWLSQGGEEEGADPFSWAVVLSVSWDALFSGPAKSAQAYNWTSDQVLWSFLISGATVSILAVASVALTRRLAKISGRLRPKSVRKFALLQMLTMYCEFSILLYFGMLSLFRYSAGSNLPDPVVAALAAGCGLIFFAVIGRPLLRETGRRVGLAIPSGSG